MAKKTTKKKDPETRVEPLTAGADRQDLPQPAVEVSPSPVRTGLNFRGKHLEILADTSPELCVEGARNSGKTWVLCAKVVQNCLDYPGIEWLACRYSGTETDNKLRPELVRIAGRMGVELAWDAEQEVYTFPEKRGKSSKIYCYGLKTISREAMYAKIRGLGVASVWNDQTEELPENIAEELRFALRQPGYPHQLIFSPNPPGEDHWLADQFPDEDPLPGRTLYRLSIYDNAHNLDAKTLNQTEQMFPATHARHKSLVLGQRGVNVNGKSVYQYAFNRDVHFVPVRYDPDSELLEAIDSGKNNATWLVCQRSSIGGIHVLGGIMGKRLFLEEFLPIVSRYRQEWFGTSPKSRLCCDPPADAHSARLRFTNVALLREAGLSPVWRDNATAPDVRETVIQSLAGYMQRTIGPLRAFAINNDMSRWLMASHTIVKRSPFFIDGVEGAYVWDENLVSVASKKVRQPKVDEWVDGAQRCLENICLNFCAGQPNEDAAAAEKARIANLLRPLSRPKGMPFGQGHLG